MSLVLIEITREIIIQHIKAIHEQGKTDANMDEILGMPNAMFSSTPPTLLNFQLNYDAPFEVSDAHGSRKFSTLKSILEAKIVICLL